MTFSSSGRRAAVIGSGFGGLAAAIRLQAAGVPTTIFEKRERIGGRAYQFVERGYVFDMGPSLITAPQVINSVFQAAGKELSDYLDLVPLDPFYRVHFHDGTSLEYVGDPERMKSQMEAFNPRDAERLDDFLAAIKPIYQAVITDRLGSRPFDTIKSMIGFAPKVLALRAYEPVTRFVRRYFEDWRHRFLYSFHPLFLGGNPFEAPSIYLMIPYLEREGGVWFTRGGMYSVVEAMGRLFQELGGEIRTESEVERVTERGGRVTGVETLGEFHPADIVVSNADVAHTYSHLLADSDRRRWTDRRLRGVEQSMSCFLLYLGVRRRYPQLAHHTLILTERYEGLVKDIFRRKVLTEDFSMYLHAPTRTDESMAPPGCESLYVLVPVPNLASGTDWSEAGPVLKERVLDVLEEWGLEDLRSSLDVLRMFTPEDFHHELNATLGNAFGVEPRLTQTAWFRPHNRSEELQGLYLVGAGTHPGAGVPGVILSAEATYGCIAADHGLDPQPDIDEPGRVAIADIAAS
ncbi:MAG: phytoene desaturase [Gemmatimonadetes bacterium]|nr:phytoene desaturase [Gemmatimonadota bacterium]